MVKIIDNLYLDSYDEYLANSAEYDIIINCASLECESPIASEAKHKIHKYEIKDTPVQKIKEYINEIISIINNNIKDKKILIHCYSGISRSASFVLAYLVENRKMSLNDAFTFVREKRNILPNVYFMKQLIEYEYEISDKKTFDMDKYMVLYLSETFKINKEIVEEAYNK